MPGVNDPNVAGKIVIQGDGVGYTFRSNATYEGMTGDDHIQFTSNVGTTLARWADESLRKLEPCWSKGPPTDR
jgi:hypothetical protein